MALWIGTRGNQVNYFFYYSLFTSLRRNWVSEVCVCGGARSQGLFVTSLLRGLSSVFLIKLLEVEQLSS